VKLRSAIFALLLLSTAQVSLAQRDPLKYTRYLLPFHGPTQGAGGAWIAEWWFRNEGPTAADVFPLTFGCFCPVGYTVLRGAPAIPPQTTLLGYGGDTLPVPFYVPPGPALKTNTPGAFVYVETARRADVKVQGQIWWSGDRALQAVHMNAIPEDQFVTGTRSVMPVKANANTRYSVRIYALPETTTNSRVNITVYEMQPVAGFVNPVPAENLLTSILTEVKIIPDDRFFCDPCDLPQIPLRAALAEVFNINAIPPTGGGRSVRFEIRPEGAGLKYWAVVSATDNSTNNLQVYELTR
jgi:hypothetical protein